MASMKAKRLREEEPSAVIIPFPVIARRDVDAVTKLPFPVVPHRASEPIASRAAPEAANQNDRPTLPSLQRGRRWEAAIAISLLFHVVAVLAFAQKYSYDLERAAGAAAATATEGALTIPVEVIVNAALPSAPAPVEATAPEEKTVAPPAPQPEEISKEKEKTEAAPPQKSDDAAEVVPAAKETPKPEKKKAERKKKETPRASRSAAANPSPAAASHSQGRAGAGGHNRESGGTANISSYQAQVIAHLQRYRVYPPSAKDAGIRGTATVRFTLSSSGRVTSASLIRGSGAAVLDQAALSMVYRASPFPPFPSGIGRSSMAFAAPVRFDLR